MTTAAPEYVLTVDQDGATLNWQGQTFVIERTDLVDGGWHERLDCDPCERRHVDEMPGGATAPLDALRRWHDQDSGHPDPFVLCTEGPCPPLREVLEDWA